MKAYDAADPQTKRRTFRFLDGSLMNAAADACRGCIMNECSDSLPKEIRPVYDDGEIVVRQDAEWPVPGFYIVGIRSHIGSYDLIGRQMHMKMSELIRATRSIQRHLIGISHVHLLQEEKRIGAHLHYWLLPLWDEVMEKHDINPRLYEGNIIQYLTLFNYTDTKDQIERYNKIMYQALPEYIKK